MNTKLCIYSHEYVNICAYFRIQMDQIGTATTSPKPATTASSLAHSRRRAQLRRSKRATRAVVDTTRNKAKPSCTSTPHSAPK